MSDQACDVSPGEIEMKRQSELAQQIVHSTPPPYYGALIGAERPLTVAECEQRNRDAQAQQAVYVLEQARQIRANPVLMADVRAHIRKLRDDGAALLDDIGG